MFVLSRSEGRWQRQKEASKLKKGNIKNILIKVMASLSSTAFPELKFVLYRFFCRKHKLSFEKMYFFLFDLTSKLFFILSSNERPNVLYFSYFVKVYLELKNTELDKVYVNNILIYFKPWLKELHLGLYYPLNIILIVPLSKPTE